MRRRARPPAAATIPSLARACALRRGRPLTPRRRGRKMSRRGGGPRGMGGGTGGKLKEGSVRRPVVLGAGATYYLMAQGNAGGGSWYDINTTVSTTSVATELSGVYGPGGTTWTSFGSAGQTFGPV